MIRKKEYGGNKCYRLGEIIFMKGVKYKVFDEDSSGEYIYLCNIKTKDLKKVKGIIEKK